MTRVAVVGAGAMGGVWAAHLAGAGHEVALVDTSPAVVAALALEPGATLRFDGADPSGWALE